MSGPDKNTRLLVVNPNTTQAVTEAFLAEARRIAPADVAMDGATGHYGAPIVSIEAENIIASHVALEILAARGRNYDAAILAISFDSGLVAAREIMPIPVIGITEAALLAAMAAGERIGIVSFGQVSVPLYRRLLHAYRMEDRVAGWEVVEVYAASGILDTQAQDAAVVEAIYRLQDQGAGAVAVLGTAMVGVGRRLQPLVRAALFDGAAPSIEAALAAIRADERAERPYLPLSRCHGVPSGLADLIAGSAPPAA